MVVDFKMIGLNKDDGPRPKCFFTSSLLPQFVHHEQIPERKKPFSTILSQAFSHSLTLVLPTESADDLKKTLESGVGLLQYAKVYMKLGELIEGDFFNQYIKSRNVLMLSSGRPGLDHVFSLREGVLRLEVDKATHERMGLDGVAIPSGGRKHVKTRYAIELNLRLPSMVRGKHGFERIVWAFKNILNQTVTWLFYDLKGRDDGSGPISQHQPKINSVEPQVQTMEGIQVREMPDNIKEDDYDDAADLLEWLSLATLGSPRIQANDRTDNYLSRNCVPTAETNKCSTQDLVKFQWHGFLPAIFIRSVFIAAMKASGAEWFGMTAASFDGKGYSTLQRNQHTLTWEYMD